MRTLIGRRGILAAGATLTAAIRPRNSAWAEDMRPLSSIARLQPPGVLPDLAFVTLEGARLALSALRGKPLVLNFWATWCGPCVLELPALDRLAASGVTVVAASTDHGGADIVKPFLARHGIGHLRVVLDPGNESTHAAGVVGFPTTLIIDAQGRLRGRLEGPADWSGAASLIAGIVT
jgi:thiol-disulfide isomerase/thioredoxin